MNCCSCGVAPVASSCRQTITSADLATLLYTQGLDANLCTKFAPVVAGLSLVDCEGNPIVIGQSVVTCAEFAALLCETVAGWDSGAIAVPGSTELLGADCLTHVLPTLCDQLAVLPTGDPVILDVTPVLGADCEFHTVPETPITVTDTSTIDFTASGPYNHDITGVVKVSAVPGNEITIQADGLYAPSQNDITIVATDTPCLNPISGNPIISPNAGNQLSCAGNGLYAAAGDSPIPVTITGLDTPCGEIDVTEIGPNDFQISISPVVSPNAGNALSCEGNGLYVPEVIVQAIDNGCIELDSVESPVNTWTLTPTLVISPNAGNAASCLDNGLYVPVGDFVLTCDDVIATFTADGGPIPPGTHFLADDCSAYLIPDAPTAITVSVTDTDSIDLTLTHIGDNYDISADVIVAPTATGFPASCNGLVLQGDGLAVEPPHPSTHDSTVITGSVWTGPVTVFDVFTGVTHTVLVDNPSSCRAANLLVLFRTPGINTDGTPFGFALDQTQRYNINLPGVLVTGGFVVFNNQQLVDNDQTGEDSPSSETTLMFTLPAGFVGGQIDTFVEYTCLAYAGVTFDANLEDTRVSYLLTTI